MRAWEFMSEDYHTIDRPITAGPRSAFGGTAPIQQRIGSQSDGEIDHEMIARLEAKAVSAENGHNVVSMKGWTREQIKDFFRS